MRTLLASILALFAFFPLTAAAQTPGVIQGLQVIAERQYAMDIENPVDTSGDGIFMASVRVYQFDTEEHANPVYEQLVDAEAVMAQIPEDDDTVSLDTSELDDVGDRATILDLRAEMQKDGLGHFRTVIAQQDGIVISVTVIAGSAESSQAAEEIAAAMIERDPGTGESTYEGTGKSSGGVWDVFLPADADELHGLQAYMDKETRPRA